MAISLKHRNTLFCYPYKNITDIRTIDNEKGLEIKYKWRRSKISIIRTNDSHFVIFASYDDFNELIDTISTHLQPVLDPNNKFVWFE